MGISYQAATQTAQDDLRPRGEVDTAEHDISHSFEAGKQQEKPISFLADNEETPHQQQNQEHSTRNFQFYSQNPHPTLTPQKPITWRTRVRFRNRSQRRAFFKLLATMIFEWAVVLLFLWIWFSNQDAILAPAVSVCRRFLWGRDTDRGVGDAEAQTPVRGGFEGIGKDKRGKGGGSWFRSVKGCIRACLGGIAGVLQGVGRRVREVCRAYGSPVAISITQQRIVNILLPVEEGALLPFLEESTVRQPGEGETATNANSDPISVRQEQYDPAVKTDEEPLLVNYQKHQHTEKDLRRRKRVRFSTTPSEQIIVPPATMQETETQTRNDQHPPDIIAPTPIPGRIGAPYKGSMMEQLLSKWDLGQGET